MKILHTSDWHLGKNLENRSRLDEQREFIEELCEIVEKEKVHLVMIAGDVFDTYNPPSAAESLFYEALQRLAGGGKRAVVVIAGNHDNPERLCAAKPLADSQGIVLMGLPSSEVTPMLQGHLGVQVANSGQGWLEISIEGVEEHAVVTALPYPSEARLAQILTEELDENQNQRAYSEKIGEIFETLSQHYREDTVNLAVSHIFIAGGEETESERPIQLGGALTVHPHMLPGRAHYVALGHLHRPQQMKMAKTKAYYSGSPLAYSFSEAGYSKAVYLIDAEPKKEAQVTPIYLKAGKPLVKWVAKEGYHQVLEWCQEEKDKNAWIDLEIYVQEVLTQEQIKEIRRLRPQILNIRPKVMEQQEIAYGERRMHKKIDALFSDFYIRKNGIEPSEELLECFLELMQEGEDEIETQETYD